jgi:hypothetical protein
LTPSRNNPISKFDNEMQNSIKNTTNDRRDQDLYAGLIRLHILHHAAKAPVFGLWFIEELGRHGYKLSPGTLYPPIDERTVGQERAADVSGDCSGAQSISGRATKSQRALWRAVGRGMN